MWFQKLGKLYQIAFHQSFRWQSFPLYSILTGTTKSQFSRICSSVMSYPNGSFACHTVWGRPKNSLVTVVHVSGPLPECWLSQSDNFTHFITKQITINHILLYWNKGLNLVCNSVSKCRELMLLIRALTGANKAQTYSIILLLLIITL